MGFSEKQIRALQRNLHPRNIRVRVSDGKEFSYIEGWFAISEANRIFGFDGWDRETIDAKCVQAREVRGSHAVAYTARVRISVRSDDRVTVRDGFGTGEARGGLLGEAHDLALKAAETDATKRALVTFGKAFGLSLYAAQRRPAGPVEAIVSPHVGTRPPSSGNDAVKCDEQGGNLSPFRAPIDKSKLALSEPRRLRDKDHLRYVASQPCIVCNRILAEAHHVRFAQPKAFGAKVSDEFTVPLCRDHHRELHNNGNESAWWHDMGIEPLPVARRLWDESRVEHRTTAKNDTIERPMQAIKASERVGKD